MNTALLLDMAADTWPARAAVCCAGRVLTFDALRRLADATAQRARAQGARSIALLDVNGPAAFVAMYAAARAELPYAPLNYRLSREELEWQLARLDAPLVVAAASHLEGLRSPERAVAVPSDRLLDEAPAAAAVFVAGDPDADAIAVQLFTSGTSGPPKTAVLRHGQLSAYVLATVEFGGAGENEATLIAVPPYHVAGIAAMLTSTYAGRRTVILPRFDAAAWLALAAAERVTQGFLVPTMLARIVAHLEQSAEPPPATLRAIAYGGGGMPAPVIERAMRRFPAVEFTNAYGLTETSSTICLLTPEDHRAAVSGDDARLRARLGSVGRPLPSVEIQVRDEAGAVLGANRPGLIFVRGPQVSGEYRESGRQLDACGWFATHDRGWIDDAGYVFLDGRADDVIVRGGENISPGEIEAALRDHPAVADAAVFAVASEEWGETVGAVIVPAEGHCVGAPELQAWVRARLRGSRVPERVVFRDRLPYNEMGKLLRRELRRELGGPTA
jgi:acyl-CoA synthetase (AMP-forming)/AMP-acid ligase II